MAEHKPEIVEAILDDGHEVGSHGWRHPTITDRPDDRLPLLTGLTDTELAEHLGNSERILQRLGAQPKGFRAIQFACDERVLQCAATLFRYDSSLSDKQSQSWVPDGLHELPLATFTGTRVKLGTPVLFGPAAVFPYPLLGLVSTSDPLVIYGHSFDFVPCSVPLYTSAFKRYWYFNRCGPARLADVRGVIIGLQRRGARFVTGAEWLELRHGLLEARAS